MHPASPPTVQPTRPRLSWIGYLAMLGSLGFLVGGCFSWRTERIDGPGISNFDYKDSCGGCHELPKPKTRSDEEWQEFILKHRLISGHDEETAQLFADYLKERN